jgi:tetratricopeptide (TPR) repeat protein
MRYNLCMDAQKLEEQAGLLRNAGKGYEAVEIYKKAKDAYLITGDMAKAAGCQHMIGVSYKIENDIDAALVAYDLAIADYQKTDDTFGPGRVERDIGIMFEYQDRFNEAEQHLLKSKDILTDEQGAELGITFAKVGLLYTRMQKMGEAEAPILEGLKLIRQSGQPFYELTALMHLGGLYLATGHAGRALANLQASLGLIYEYNMQREQTRRLAQIWGLMAHCYLAHDNRATAKHFAQKATNVIEGLSPSAQGPLCKDIQFDQLQAQLS